MTEYENMDSSPLKTGDLRREAERRLRGRETVPVERMADVDVRALLHELQVHQIELEMQNEELLRAQAALQDVSSKYQDLFDFAPIGYFLLDEQGRIVEVNLAGAALLGLDRSAAVYRWFGEQVPAPSRDRLAEFFHHVLSADSKQTCVTEFQRGDRRINVLLEGILSSDGRGNRALRVIVTDITERKRAKEELHHAKEAAEAASRAKDRFLAILSHELRTPLMPVVLGVSMLQARSDLDPAVRETLAMVRRNAELEALLIDDLLDMTRIARGKVELHKQVIELGTVIQRAVDVCRADIEAGGLEFGMDLGSAVPCWVEADASRLQQVFWNLLKNAIKFTPRGGRIRIHCHLDGPRQVVAEVTDSGIGIAPEVLPRLFHAFEQIDRSITRQFGGLGLGLAISKALVEMHGGSLDARSEGKGKGTTFRLRLSLGSPAEMPEAPAADTLQNHAIRPLHILLVEDDGVSAKMVRLVAELDGHTVEAAGDVATALQLADRHAFDLLVSDLGLPDGSGHDLMRELRLRGHDFPGIVLSGYGQPEDIRRSYEAGFAAHLTKPASREAIVEAVASVTAAAPTASH
ncbi:MAG: ATP-binding protein [Planctomycetota bacterium]